MPEFITHPLPTPEKKETSEDNARKFTIGLIGQDFLQAHQATCFVLTVDWLETGEDTEKKLAYKKFDTGEIQILLISKVTLDGNRRSEKKKITETEYKEKLEESILHLEKKRYEFKFEQNGIVYDVKYDEFADGTLQILEVDAPTEADRELFNPLEFPFKMTEVTGDMKYYGYRVVEVVGKG